MPSIKVIFGSYGDSGVTSLLYEVIENLPNKYDVKVDIETDLLYDYTSPMIEINGRKILFDYIDEEDAKAKLSKLIRGELIEDHKPFKIFYNQDGIFSNGVSVL
ncbi:hypothetical protein [Acidianus sp. HS-5]|uniref:hypothetical protein n=1 Tax=Acidianus sp. HS-5 TaxID=2886040 RepID=UPI001F17EA9C|nr:hypothetical protein [Acidianus sp. HS-5]BDC19361.1 hypothetical protein HS5_22510 [Acidianus sp. HS-5]